MDNDDFISGQDDPGSVWYVDDEDGKGTGGGSETKFYIKLALICWGVIGLLFALVFCPVLI